MVWPIRAGTMARLPYQKHRVKERKSNIIGSDQYETNETIEKNLRDPPPSMAFLASILTSWSTKMILMVFAATVDNGRVTFGAALPATCFPANLDATTNARFI